MINKSELRIGNIVQDTGFRVTSYCTIEELGRWIARLHSITEDIPLALEYAKITPIPLSPELLEACGFELVEGIVGQYELRTDRFYFSFYEGKNDIMIHDMKQINTLARGIADLKIEYLHQLQNLVYDLTGAELSINFEKVKA